MGKDGELTLRELVGLGMCELRSRAHRGEVRGRHVWVALRGAMRYHRAIERGDVAGEGDLANRASTCGSCEHRQRREVETAEGKVFASYCGEPFVDKSGPEGTQGTCGCLVMVTVAGHEVSDHAAGRAVVASERCSLKRPRWKEVEAIGARE